MRESPVPSRFVLHTPGLRLPPAGPGPWTIPDRDRAVWEKLETLLAEDNIEASIFKR